MKLVLASANRHKARELAGMAAATGLAVEIVPATEVGGMPPVAEDTGTFEGNVRKKALALVPRLPQGAWALADDSGLCVDALGGAPGVESAYYAGPAGDPAANLAKLVLAMRGVPPGGRAARFVCILALASTGGVLGLFRGECDGTLATEPRGGGGFGYDPLFVPSGQDLTFAELGDAAKAGLSHRARAFARLAEWLVGREGAPPK
jgi:XTP/dITP diphosphohydrolase